MINKGNGKYLIFLILIIGAGALLNGLNHSGGGIEGAGIAVFGFFCILLGLITLIINVIIYFKEKRKSNTPKLDKFMLERMSKIILISNYSIICISILILFFDNTEPFFGIDFDDLKVFVVYMLIFGTLSYLIYAKKYWAYLLIISLIILQFSLVIDSFNITKTVILSIIYLSCLYMLLFNKYVYNYIKS